MTHTTLATGVPILRPTDEPTGLGWALWAVALSMPWLLPIHTPPWSTFYNDAMMAAVMLPMAAWVLWASRRGWRLDILAAGFAGAALVPLLQALGHLVTFPAEAVLISLYLSAFALTLLVARHGQDAAPFRLIEGLFAGVGVAALLSAGIALCQWLEVDSRALLLAQIPLGERPIGNVGHPNNLSTLLAWGLVAFWWAHSRRRIGPVVATLAAAFLLVGMALTQSRTGWLAVVLIGVAAVVGRRALRTSNQAPVMIGLALWFVFVVLSLDPLANLLLHAPPRSLSEQMAAGGRPVIWRLTFDAISQHPWLGYGWNQSLRAHVGMVAQYPLHVGIGHAHNVVLDLIMWNGLPLAALMVGGLCLWFRHMLRGELSAEQALVLIALAVFVLHAMLELPHTYGFFLLPAAVMMGTLNALRPLPTLVHLPRLFVALVVLVYAGLLVVIFNDYGQIKGGIDSARLRAARIGTAAPAAVPEVHVLRLLQDAFDTLRTEPRRGMPLQDLARMKATVTRYPVHAGLFRYAQASALNGRPDEARWAFEVLCGMNPVDTCEAAVKGWAEVAAEGYPEMNAVPMPTPEAAPPRP